MLSKGGGAWHAGRSLLGSYRTCSRLCQPAHARLRAAHRDGCVEPTGVKPEKLIKSCARHIDQFSCSAHGSFFVLARAAICTYGTKIDPRTHIKQVAHQTRSKSVPATERSIAIVSGFGRDTLRCSHMCQTTSKSGNSDMSTCTA